MGEGGKTKEDLINELRQMRQWLRIMCRINIFP